MVDQGSGAARRGQLRRVDVVLEDDGDAVERAPHVSRPPVGITGLRVGERPRAEGEEGPERRTVAVVQGQPRQVLADDVLARDNAARVIAFWRSVTVFSMTVNGGGVA